MNQRIGLTLLIIGIGLTAGFGSKLSPEVRAALVDEGQQVMAQNAVDARFAQYCATRSNEGAGDGDGGEGGRGTRGGDGKRGTRRVDRGGEECV